MVEKIQLAVNAYYGQFDVGVEPGMAAEVDAGAEAVAEESVDAGAEAVGEPSVEAGVEPGDAAQPEPEAPPSGELEAREAQEESGLAPDSIAPESDTMSDSRSSAQFPDEKGEVHES